MKYLFFFGIFCFIALAVHCKHCLTTSECNHEDMCVDNQCVDPGIALGGDARKKPQISSCKLIVDCPPGFQCINGACVPFREKRFIYCQTSADCKHGYQCIDRECVPIKNV